MLWLSFIFERPTVGVRFRIFTLPALPTMSPSKNQTLWHFGENKTNRKLFYFEVEHPHPLLVEILWGWALQGHSGAGHWGQSGVGEFRETLQGDSGWAPQGDSWAQDTLGLGTPGI